MLLMGYAGLSSAQTSYNYDYAQQIFDKLVKTINLTTPSKPKLVVVFDNDFVARTYPQGEIRVGYSLIDHCRSFGADSCNALAHVLSHELTHYYANHFWAENFGTAYADMHWGEEIAQAGVDTSVRKLYETQADEYGMYYAFSAGYKTLHVAPHLLDSIYTWYHLSPEMPGYPSLSDRKEIATESAENIAALIPAFESANLMLELAQTLGGDQQNALLSLALSGYGHILDAHIHTVELYNNLAAGKIILALSYADDPYASLRLPVMLETKSYLYNSSGSRGMGNADPDQMSSLLSDAETACENALKLDKNFYPAYINSALIYYLEGKKGSASDALDAARNIMGKEHPMAWTLYEIQALLDAADGNIKAMQTDFAEAAKAGSRSASYNEKVLSEKADNSSASQGNAVQSLMPDTLETIDSTWIGDFLNALPVPKNHRLDLHDGSAIIFSDTMQGYVYYDIKPRTAGIALHKIRFFVSADDALKTSKGLSRGDTQKQLEKLYGGPSYTLAESDASIRIYPSRNLMVWIQDGKVYKWAYWLVR